MVLDPIMRFEIISVVVPSARNPAVVKRPPSVPPLLCTWKMIASVVPEPDVDLSVRVPPALELPMRSGVWSEVPAYAAPVTVEEAEKIPLVAVTMPLALIENAEALEVAVKVEVAMKKLLPAARKVHRLSAVALSPSAN